jgi:hypothetical protein
MEAVERVRRARRSATGLTQSAARRGWGVVERHDAVAVDDGGASTVGLRLTGKWLGRWLTERVNDGSAATGIRRGQRSEGGVDEKVMGVCPRGAQSEDGGGKRGPRRSGVVRPFLGGGG